MHAGRYTSLWCYDVISRNFEFVCLRKGFLYHHILSVKVVVLGTIPILEMVVVSRVEGFARLR